MQNASNLNAQTFFNTSQMKDDKLSLLFLTVRVIYKTCGLIHLGPRLMIKQHEASIIQVFSNVAKKTVVRLIKAEFFLTIVFHG